MELDEFEKCNGKPQTRSSCTKPDKQTAHLGAAEREQTAYGYGHGYCGMGMFPDYDEDDGYFRHVAADSVRRDHYGFRVDHTAVQPPQKVIGPVEIVREK